MLQPLQYAENWIRAGKRVALATVIETWGSAPRPLGSHLVIDQDGLFEGSVSGGCVEGAVVSEALDILETGVAKTLHFGVQDETAWEVGLSCGGKISIYIEPISLTSIQQLNANILARIPCVLITHTTAHSSELLSLNAFDNHALRGKVKGNHTTKIDDFLVAFHLPPLKFVITGAVHISQCLVQVARSLNLEPVIVDPRTAFASAERFPDVTIHARWTADILDELALDQYTAFAALTHDPKIDDPALEAALHAKCFYIGALGSRKTHTKRVARLTDKGFSEAEIALIKAPIGLDIGAISPQEIALSIMAEILAEARK